jgi:hypothetical protein
MSAPAHYTCRLCNCQSTHELVKESHMHECGTDHTCSLSRKAAPKPAALLL